MYVDISLKNIENYLTISSILLLHKPSKRPKRLSEEGFEANNKRLRMYREKLSRKNNQISNLEDCFKRLWAGSDPLVCQQRANGRPKCSVCQAIGHTKLSCPSNTNSNDSLLTNLFIE